MEIIDTRGRLTERLVSGNLCGVRIVEMRLHQKDIEKLFEIKDSDRLVELLESWLVRFAEDKGNVLMCNQNDMNDLMKYFKYDHLPEKLQAVSGPICQLAQEVYRTTPNNVEKLVGLRKLLEAKDCIVRASL